MSKTSEREREQCTTKTCSVKVKRGFESYDGANKINGEHIRPLQ